MHAQVTERAKPQLVTLLTACPDALLGFSQLGFWRDSDDFRFSLIRFSHLNFVPKGSNCPGVFSLIQLMKFTS